MDGLTRGAPPFSNFLRLFNNHSFFVLLVDNERTLFRSHGGLQLIRDHPTLSRCLSVMPRDLSREEIDVCTSAVDLFSAACTDNGKWVLFIHTIFHIEGKKDHTKIDKCKIFFRLQPRYKGLIFQKLFQ